MQGYRHYSGEGVVQEQKVVIIVVQMRASGPVNSFPRGRFQKFLITLRIQECFYASRKWKRNQSSGDSSERSKANKSFRNMSGFSFLIRICSSSSMTQKKKIKKQTEKQKLEGEKTKLSRNEYTRVSNVKSTRSVEKFDSLFSARTNSRSNCLCAQVYHLQQRLLKGALPVQLSKRCAILAGDEFSPEAHKRSSKQQASGNSKIYFKIRASS